MVTQFDVLKDCLDVIYGCLRDDAFALLSEHYIRVKLISNLCQKGYKFEEAIRQTGRSTLVWQEEGEDIINTKVITRSDIHVTPGKNLDVKISEPFPVSIELKCRGNFGSNATLDRKRYMQDVDRAVFLYADFFILAATREGYSNLYEYTYVRSDADEPEQFSAAAPHYDRIRLEDFSLFEGQWGGGKNSVLARRVATPFGDERVLLAFFDYSGAVLNMSSIHVSESR